MVRAAACYHSDGNAYKRYFLRHGHFEEHLALVLGHFIHLTFRQPAKISRSKAI
jgi:hypothetical protein